MERILLQTPLSKKTACSLRCGDNVLISGILYTARDAAHKRMCDAATRGEKLPFNPEGAVVYFVGPTPAKPGQAIGSAGPTTSYRMDAYSPALIKLGLTGMIGKGKRSAEVIDAMKQYGTVYFGAIGGCGALLAKCVEKAEVIAYPDLGTEAVRRLVVRAFPATVVIDTLGNNLYETGRQAYLQSLALH
ncbi:MAG: Fe-S-containing hydro-lyase [Clostridia bacterium]